MTLLDSCTAVALFLPCIVAFDEQNRVSEKKPLARVEVRLAENQPAEGLTEATVFGTDQKVYLHRSAALTEADIADARVARDELKQPAIEVDFTEEGAEKVAKLSRENLNKMLAILVDGKVVSAPVIRAEFSASARITGNFTIEEATRIQQAMLGKRPQPESGMPKE